MYPHNFKKCKNKTEFLYKIHVFTTKATRTVYKNNMWPAA
jgi:hypothetical protein